MTVKDALTDARMMYQVYGFTTAAKRTLWEARARTIGAPDAKKPDGVPDQYQYVQDALQESGTWVLWLDGGRYDWFKRLYPEYFEGTLQKVWNGGVGYTGDWSVRNLDQRYPDTGIFSSVLPGDCNAVEYDDLRHFDLAEDVRLPGDPSVRDRLATLGYMEVNGNEVTEISPGATNEMVRRHRDRVDGGLVRYLKPHPPLKGLEEITRGSGKVRNTHEALRDGKLTFDELEAAYVDTYREVLDAVATLASELDGRVIITADHGECLRCGQLFHSRTHRKHGHLVNVPWFEVAEVL
jgi:hypothetical protein